MIYQINNGLVRYAADTILDHINFEIRNTEKIAVVGRNGCGKTTLFKLIAGILPLDNPDSDEDSWISKAGNTTIGFLQQISFENEDTTAEEELLKAFGPLLSWKDKLEQLCARMETDHSQEVMDNYARTLGLFESMGGYGYQSEMETMVTQFGFDLADVKRPIINFSGGQQTKLAFIKLLLSKPDILLLDEPTNHLDLPTIEWLERYLRQYPKAVVIVSHDRMFLDKTTDVTYEIEHRRMTRYQGNYSSFVKQKRLNWDKQQKDYLLQQKEIARLMTLVEKYKHHPTKVAMTKSKLKQIEHMDIVKSPDQYDLRTFHAEFKPLRAGGQEVVKADHLSIGYDRPLSEVSFEVKKGQRLAVIGENGIGKSTLLKTLVGQVDSLGGAYSYGFQIDHGYFDQQLAQIENDKTVLEDFGDEFPDMVISEVRSSLACFLFTQDTVYKKVCQLSGGEKVRLCLAKILKKRPNFLLLDEPTNHMDIVGKEALESMLKSYEGTVLFVSHDRYFVQEIADSLLIFEEGRADYYPYGYQEYMEKKNLPQEAEFAGGRIRQRGGQTGIRKVMQQDLRHDKKQDMQQDKQQDLRQDMQQNMPQNMKKDMAYNKKRDRKYDKKLQEMKKQKMRKLEALVEETEQEIYRVKLSMETPEIATDYVRLSELHEQLTREESKLDEYLELFMQYQEEAEELA